MRTTLDERGRLRIPAEIRRQLGLEPGTPLEILVEADGLRLVRAVTGPKLERRGSRLVARPTCPPDRLPRVDVAGAVRRSRPSLKQILGSVPGGADDADFARPREVEMRPLDGFGEE